MNGQLKLYTSTGTRKFIEQCNRFNVGLLLVPPTWRKTDEWPYFAVDNGCFSAYSRGVEWDPEPFSKMLDRIRDNDLSPDFIVIPDKVADSFETVRMAKEWIGILKERYPNFPRYMAVQDGMSEEDVSEFIPDISGVFVGGTMDWKLQTMADWSRFAHDNGMGCHVGRIGLVRRMMLAELSGADSIDSTTWVQTRGGVNHYVGGYRSQTRITEGYDG